MPKPRKVVEASVPAHDGGVAERLTKYRKLRGLTQTQLAEKVGVTRYLIAHCEKGRTHLTDELIVRLAVALRVTPDDLLGFSKTTQAVDRPPSVRLVRRMQRIAELTTVNQKAILRTIDSFLDGAESNNNQRRH